MKFRKRLLIIGAGIMQIPAIKTAREMGLKTIVTDYNSSSEGFKYCDVPLIMSTRDVDGTVRLAKEYNKKEPIDGVITVGTDASMTVAAVANALGLPGIKFENAEAATNKIKMRKRFKEAKVPSPDFYECWTFEDAKANAKKIGFPLVLKPSDNMGSRGVMRVTNAEQLMAAFQHAKSASPSGELIIEELMEGDELSIDSLVYKGKVHICGIADRIIGYPPYFVELGHIMPSNRSKKVLNKAVEVMKKGIAALGIDIGAAKGDIKLTKKGPMIGELAARLSGGYMSGYTYPYATGVNLIKGAIEIAIGDAPTDLKPKFHKVSYERAIIPNPGYIIDIRNLRETYDIPGVKNIFLLKKEGDIVTVPKSNVEKSGNIIVTANTRKEAFSVMEKAMNTLKIDIGPMPILSYEDLRRNAREKFNGKCYACPVCDAVNCASGVPGMGGVGNGNSFRKNVEYLQSINIRFRYIHSTRRVSSRCELWGYQLSMPVLAGPLTGVDVNMGASISEYEYQKHVLVGSRLAGTMGVVGDGAQPELYKMGMKALKEEKGWGMAIFKPREIQSDIIKRLKEAEENGAIAVGIDVDAAAFTTFRLANQPVAPKSLAELKELVKSVKVPFIVKGVLTLEDVGMAVKAGAAAIVVSNHGGRVSDSTPTSWEVLPEIAKAFKNKIKIMADGGVRSGADIFKAISLGADVVWIGRPIAIAAIGSAEAGVDFYFNKLHRELEETMLLADSPTLASIDKSKIMINKIFEEGKR